MQKKIIALAVAGLVSGGAFAQSNVTISGQFKVGMDSVSASGATANAAGVSSNYTSRTRVVDNNSNIRFSGSENLGNGMTAVFQVESALGTSDYDGTGSGNVSGTRFATLGSRDTFVGLSGNWGTVALGKHSVHYNSMANVEGAGLVDGLALVTSSLNLLNTINGTSLLGSTRLTNAIAYISPTWNGFNAMVGYTTLGEMTTVNQAKKDNGLNVKLAYNNGPIAATYSYLAVNGAGATAPTAAAGATVTCYDPALSTSATTTLAACALLTGIATSSTAAVAANTGNGSDVRSNRLGAAYTFPMGLKVGLIWDKSKNTNKGAPAGDTWIERSAWALPISYRTGAHNFSFTYAKTNNTSVDSATGLTAARVAGWDDSAKMTMLGYEYSMSKRTSVAMSWTQINNSSQGIYDFWHPSSNVANGGGALAAASNGADPRAFSVNLTHKF
jgi:predicted porin